MQQAVQWVETAIHGQAAGNLVSNVNDLAYPLRLTWMGCMVIGWMLMLIMLGILVTPLLKKSRYIKSPLTRESVDSTAIESQPDSTSDANSNISSQKLLFRKY